VDSLLHSHRQRLVKRLVAMAQPNTQQSGSGKQSFAQWATGVKPQPKRKSKFDNRMILVLASTGLVRLAGEQARNGSIHQERCSKAASSIQSE
jgi:hypothetical protein